MSCVHEQQLLMIEEAARRFPLMLLWKCHDESTCQVGNMEPVESPDPLSTEPCDEVATWDVMLPTESGVAGLSLCSRHLALLLLRGNDDDLIQEF